MLLAILILTGMEFATNQTTSLQYALEHSRPAVVLPFPKFVISTNEDDVIVDCFDVTAGVMLTSNECFGAPAPTNLTASWTPGHTIEDNPQPPAYEMLLASPDPTAPMYGWQVEGWVTNSIVTNYVSVVVSTTNHSSMFYAVDDVYTNQ